ncbi:MAG TPA: sulfotransferase [Bacillales bacterium]|nr:sulfotransferase [Bacillales bacterium]
MKNRKPILLSGLARSGTTWTSNILTHNPDTFYVHEPDNERLYLSTWFLKDGVHRYPYLTKGQQSPLYRKLWEKIFNNETDNPMFPKKVPVNSYDIEKRLEQKSGEIHESFFDYTEAAAKDKNIKMRIDLKKKPAGKRLMVKSIYNILALDWLEENFDFIPIVIIRHPANIISSYIKLKFNDSSRNIFTQEKLVNDYFKKFMPKVNRLEDYIEKMAAQIGGVYYVLEKQLKRHPHWILLRHDELCRDPLGQFEKLYEKSGLEWTPEIAQFIEGTNRPPEENRKFLGTYRLVNEENEKYKRLLSKEEIDKIRGVLEIFGCPFYKNI